MLQHQYDTEWYRWFHEIITLTSCLDARQRVISGENDCMVILLNGETRQTAPDATIATLLVAEGLGERRVAVEVNGCIVPRTQHPRHVLHDGDRVEIVHALGGG